jgi:hypothetical protein
MALHRSIDIALAPLNRLNRTRVALPVRHHPYYPFLHEVPVR